MIIGGGAMSVIPLPPDWGKTSAYMIALGLVILAISYLIGRLQPSHPLQG